MNQPRLDGKVAIITGANTGIGRVTARELARRGAHVFLACRSEERAQGALQEVRDMCGVNARAEFIQLDLGDLGSVRRSAEEFLSRGLPLHLLIANAGLAGQKGMTASGFELTFGTCHVGHFLLTRLLLERMKNTGSARFVAVASKAHRHAKGIDFAAVREPTKSIGGVKEYAVAKLANILFVKELRRRLEGTGVTSYAVHPGVVASDIWRSAPRPIRSILKPFMLSTEEGAATSLYCATDPSVAYHNGLYYDNCQIAESSEVSQDKVLAARLWTESERWVGL